MMLKVQDLEVSYGAIKALRGISFEVNQGEIITLIGSNGAGKTTTLHSISNIIKKVGGSVIFEGEDISSMSPDAIVRKGLIQVPEGRRIFANLSVRDNLEMGAFTRKDKAGIKADLEMVYEMFPRLKERLRQVAGTLSGGEQQKIAIARVFYKNCPYIILDEPSANLDPISEYELNKNIMESAKEKTVINISHRLSTTVMADEIYMLEKDEIIEHGSHDELMKLDGKYAYMFRFSSKNLCGK